jgi:methyl-accepting chemotaxis protein
MQGFAAKPFAQVQRIGELEAMALNAARVYARLLLVSGDADRLKLKSDFQDNSSRFEATLKEYLSNMPAEERGRVKVMAEAWPRMISVAKDYLDLAVRNDGNHAASMAGGEAAHLADVISKTSAGVEALPFVSAQVRKNASVIGSGIVMLQRDLFESVAVDDDAVLTSLNEEFTQLIDRIGKEIEALGEAGLNSGFATEANAVVAAWKTYAPLAQQAEALGVANTDDHARQAFVGAFTEARAVVSAEAKKLKSYEGSIADGFVADTQHAYENTRLVMIGAVLAAIAIGIAMAGWIGWSISRGLAKALNAAEVVAAGDLTNDLVVSGRDEIADLLRAVQEMSLKLRSVVGQVMSAAANMASGSTELSSSAEQLSQGSAEQASSTEEASSAMEEMASNVKQNADNAGQTETIARRSAADAEASGVAVGRAVDAMQTIAAKINIVQEIARQTDLLALNAAVEAARAGEHGRGFAVVASEVRKLAERSQAAAAEIGTLSAETVKVARDAGNMLSKLVPDIKRTAELVEEITAACREQDVGSTQINQAIQQLDKVTQQNASASQQVSSTSEELSSQAEMLQQTIAFFQVPGADAAPAARVDRAAKELRVTAAKMAKAVAPKRPSPPAKAAARPGKASRGGFAFDMEKAEDEQDSEFRRAG